MQRKNKLESELETVKHVYSFLREYFDHNKDCDKDILKALVEV